MLCNRGLVGEWLIDQVMATEVAKGVSGDLQPQARGKLVVTGCSLDLTWLL